MSVLIFGISNLPTFPLSSPLSKPPDLTLSPPPVPGRKQPSCALALCFLCVLWQLGNTCPELIWKFATSTAETGDSEFGSLCGCYTEYEEDESNYGQLFEVDEAYCHLERCDCFYESFIFQLLDIYLGVLTVRSSTIGGCCWGTPSARQPSLQCPAREDLGIPEKSS